MYSNTTGFKIYRFILALFALFFLYFLNSGCSIIKNIAGADIDPVQYDKARQAKVLEVRMNSLAKLSSILSKKGSIDDADFTLFLSKKLLGKITEQYIGINGWFDRSTSYVIKQTSLSLQNGSAIISLDLEAHNESYNVYVELIMDCMITFDIINNVLIMRLEPFNISPNVSAGGLLSSANEIIENLIKKNLADTEKSFPQLKIPVDISNEINIEQGKSLVRDKMNLTIINPTKKLSYKLKLIDVFIFKNAAVISMNIEGVELK